MTNLAGKRRQPAPPLAAASLLALLLLLAGTSVHSQQTPARQLRTVKASECRAQSVVQDIIFSGCSTIDSPSAGQPWCLLPKAEPTDPDIQALCAPDSIPARNARADTGETVPCAASTAPPGKQGVVLGCFTTVQAAGALKCNSGAGGLQPCRINLSKASDGPTGNVANETGAAPSSFFSGTIFGLPKAAVFGIGAFLVLAIPAAVFFFIRRRKAAAGAAAAGGKKKQNVSIEDPMPSYKEMSSAPQSPGGPGSPAGTIGSGGGLSVPAQVAVGGGTVSQRTSSQFGAGSRMSYAHGLSSPAPPMPGPPNIEGSLGKYLVISTYTPTLDDEIVIQPGDIVEIFQEFDDGWCSAVNISRGMTRGVFPMHCVDEDSRIED